MRIAVLGSVNLDLVATAPHLPAPGETVTGATLARHPGGKGANQALAARRLGAGVALIGRVGADAHADEALTLLRAEGVDLSGCVADESAPTGVALIAVVRGGDNQIVVASGANAVFGPELVPTIEADALICQLELPVETVAAAVERFDGFVALNLAPAAEVPEALLDRADLIVVNEGEAAFYGTALDRGLVAVTQGGDGAVLKLDGRVIATARPPKVEVVDTVGAGDCFVAALTIALLEQGARHPARSSRAKSRDALLERSGLEGSASLDFARDERLWLESEGVGRALRFACAAGAAATRREGAQPSLPTRAEVERLIG